MNKFYKTYCIMAISLVMISVSCKKAEDSNDDNSITAPDTLYYPSQIKIIDKMDYGPADTLLYTYEYDESFNMTQKVFVKNKFLISKELFFYTNNTLKKVTYIDNNLDTILTFDYYYKNELVDSVSVFALATSEKAYQKMYWNNTNNLDSVVKDLVVDPDEWSKYTMFYTYQDDNLVQYIFQNVFGVAINNYTYTNLKHPFYNVNISYYDADLNYMCKNAIHNIGIQNSQSGMVIYIDYHYSKINSGGFPQHFFAQKDDPTYYQEYTITYLKRVIQ